MLEKEDCKYWPYYCEENIWYLSQESVFNNIDKRVIFISNPEKQCLFLNQGAGKGGIVLWDYHVLLVTPGLAWDLDTTLPFPCSTSEYLSSTFGNPSQSPFQPLFKIIDPDLYLREFASDRSHMLNQQGNFIQPPPPWTPIQDGGESNLHIFTDMGSPALCDCILDLDNMLKWIRAFGSQQ